jgi:dephospho-CoA kinase
MIIGITGKSGVGKTTLSKLFKGYTLINVDEIAHKVLERPNIHQSIATAFGEDVANADRKVLGDVIFNNRQKMNTLTNIIWDTVCCYIDDIIRDNEDVVIDWILLPHTKYFHLCDIKILVKSEEDERVGHVLARDNISKEYLNRRDSRSIAYDEFLFDYVVHNNYNLEFLD